jgi:protein-L-isoaspartate(D-aspartate) O-methyltransferase
MMMTACNPYDFETMRDAMVASQLRPSGVTDLRILDAMSSVQRENYVPQSSRGVAYTDRPVLLGGGRALNPPLVTALLLNAVRICPGDRVLIIGAATGYAEAIVARLTNYVVAIESDETLSGPNAKHLPLERGFPSGAPYDVIIIDGAIEALPESLLDQLVDGGRLATGLIEEGITRLKIGFRAGDGFGMAVIADCDAVPLPGFSKPKIFAF